MVDYLWRRVEHLPYARLQQPPITVVRCGQARWRAGAAVRRVRRQHFQICQVTRGSAWFEARAGSDRHIVADGSLFIQASDGRSAHGTGPCGELHKRWVELAGPGLRSWLSTLGLDDMAVIDPHDPRLVTVVLRRLHRTARERQGDYLRDLGLLACELLLLLDRRNHMPRALDSALAVIDTVSVASVEEWAVRCRMPLRQLQRLCRRHLGHSPQDLLRERRLERACSLLAAGDLTIGAIADRLGFSDQFAFAHHFRRYRGCSPSHWRRHLAE